MYLDLKPENVFTLAGTNELVQLFDFDSLIPLASLNKKSSEYEYKIAFTKGFSALELQLENQKKLGKYTDVYSIGSLLFYLLFGTCPMAPDCELDAVYEYSLSKYAVKSYQDKLYFEMAEFFHNTLANYYLDRYPDMQQVIIKLEQIERLADTTVPYIQDRHIPCPKFLTGRDYETEQLRQWFIQQKRNCLLVTGIGGIGKSSLVRSYVAAHRTDFDTILYLNYYYSLKQTITDDKQFRINTVEKNEKEDTDDYFNRKLNTVKKLIQSKKVVLIIDNFCVDGFEGIDELLKLNWKVILITRSNIKIDEYDMIHIGAIREKKNLYALFEGYLRRQIEKDEYPYVDSVIQRIKGHTLVLELAAEGWLTVDSQIILMHPVIIETVHCWQITEEFCEAACRIMDTLCKMVEGETGPEGMYLRLSEEFLNCCCMESVLKESDIYQRLLYVTVINMPRHREEFILGKAAELVEENVHLNGTETIKLYDLITGIYEERRDFGNAYKVLDKIRPAIYLFHDSRIMGQYYDLWAGYYDARLDGKYDATSKKEKQIFALLMKSVDKSIKYMKKSRHTDDQKLLGEYLTAKANILVRSRPEKKNKILRLLESVKGIMKEDGLENSELARNYYLACAWYYTYVEPQLECAVQNLRKAGDIEVKIGNHALDMIDNILIPSANILLEFGESEKSAELLQRGIGLCGENEDVLPYMRKKRELYCYLLDIMKYWKLYIAGRRIKE